ncbi:tetratricopeptide repeat protein [Sphingopyxis sp.]|uniref:tetratricopeptide repeat protein n=1 Tax=Sphingopyxis sp. TaxID=1908224 RepID=UPI001D5C97D5|nr:tetratricopeptide repeat protein [Sphingopyxis sp.]MBW8294614.1 tetratricopeptide repeat protein [Sphingopyxis sp.]
MTGDDDIRAMLPDPPPAAPKPREAAIAGALARFDGAPVPTLRPQRMAASWWKKLQRPQAGLLTAAALVAAIGLPFAFTDPLPVTPAADEQVVPETKVEAPAAKRDITAAPAAGPAAAPPVTAAVSAKVAPPASRLGEVAPTSKRIEIAQAKPIAPPPPPAMRAEGPAARSVQGRARSAAEVQDAPAANYSVVSADEYSRNDRDVVVTGTRISKSRPIGRGDWNACTVNDPRQALARCQKLADKAPKSVRHQADAYLSDGLKQAWDGNLDKAIAAFGEAIAVAPNLSVAYLNRGLAHDSQGDSEAALADLDRAVQLSPKSARAYYNRSVLLRKYGDAKRASADEQQAINLDPRYQAILP